MVCLGLVVAAGLLFASSRVAWVDATASDDLRGTRTAGLSGATWAAATVPLALALLAAVAAVLAVRGWARRVVAVLVALVAVAAGLPAVALLTQGPDDAAAAALLDPPAAPATVTASAGVVGPVLALLAALVAVAAAVALLRVSRSRGGLSGRYQTPGARREQARAQLGDPAAGAAGDPATAALSERVLWDALDAGEDPTVEPLPGEGVPGGEGGGRDPGHPPSTVGPDRGVTAEGGQQGGPEAR